MNWRGGAWGSTITNFTLCDTRTAISQGFWRKTFCNTVKPFNTFPVISPSASLAEVNAKVPAAVALGGVPASYKQNKKNAFSSDQGKTKSFQQRSIIEQMAWSSLSNWGESWAWWLVFQSQHFTETEGGGSQSSRPAWSTQLSSWPARAAKQDSVSKYKTKTNNWGWIYMCIHAHTHIYVHTHFIVS